MLKKRSAILLYNNNRSAIFLNTVIARSAIAAEKRTKKKRTFFTKSCDRRKKAAIAEKIEICEWWCLKNLRFAKRRFFKHHHSQISIFSAIAAFFLRSQLFVKNVRFFLVRFSAAIAERAITVLRKIALLLLLYNKIALLFFSKK